MRRTFVTVLAAGGLLALGAWTTPGQSAPSDPVDRAETAQPEGQQDNAVCAQATADAGNRGIRRTYPRPRASSARPSADGDCSRSVPVLRREAHRAHRNTAIDRVLSGRG